MQAVVLAAGERTSARPQSESVPMPALPSGDRRLVARAIGTAIENRGTTPVTPERWTGAGRPCNLPETDGPSLAELDRDLAGGVGRRLRIVGDGRETGTDAGPGAGVALSPASEPIPARP